MARKLLEQAKARGVEIPLPTDVVVAKEFAATAHADVRSIHDVRPDEMILDIGPDTAERFAAMLQKAGTIVWNGPVGVFEFDQFGEGTRAIAQAIATVSGVLAGRRRRHARGHREVRRRRRHLLHLDRRRRVPRVRRGQDPAGRRDAPGPRQAVASELDVPSQLRADHYSRHEVRGRRFSGSLTGNLGAGLRNRTEELRTMAARLSSADCCDRTCSQLADEEWKQSTCAQRVAALQRDHASWSSA